jgi:hypothetical protein
MCDRRMGPDDRRCMFTREEHHIDAKTRSQTCGLFLAPIVKP